MANTENKDAKMEVAAVGLTGMEAFAGLKVKGAPITGLEDLSVEDIKMPKVKLAQPTSAEVTDEKCKAGQFLNVTTGDAVDTLKCQLLSMKKSRVRWPEVFKRGDNPLCRSSDYEHADETGELCANCEYSKWGADGSKPACRSAYSWLGLLEDGSPFRMMLSGAQISKCKDFLTAVMEKGYPPFIYFLELVPQKEKNESGTYYVTNFTFRKNADGSFMLINPADIDRLKGMTEDLQAMFNKARTADLVSGDAADDTDGSGGLF